MTVLRILGVVMLVWPAATAGLPRTTAGGLNLIILVDVTASRHRCPEGVAGLPSSTLAGSGQTVGSMTDRGLIPPAVEPFTLRGLRDTDTVRVGALARSVRLSEKYTGASKELARAWQSLFALPPVEWLGPSPIFDGLTAIIDVLAPEPGPRTVVIVTDGLATGNSRTAADVIKAARAADVRISVVGEESIIGLSPPLTVARATGKDPLQALSQIAESSGGRFFLWQPIIAVGQLCYDRMIDDTVSAAINAARGSKF